MNKSNTILQITSEVLDRYRNSISRKAFIQAMERVIELVLGPGEHLPQAAYHSFLGEGGNAGVVRNLRKGRKLPPADSVLVIYEQPTADGARFLEQEMTEG